MSIRRSQRDRCRGSSVIRPIEPALCRRARRRSRRLDRYGGNSAWTGEYPLWCYPIPVRGLTVVIDWLVIPLAGVQS